jgi:hypothetical protein
MGDHSLTKGLHSNTTQGHAHLVDFPKYMLGNMVAFKNSHHRREEFSSQRILSNSMIFIFKAGETKAQSAKVIYSRSHTQ